MYPTLTEGCCEVGTPHKCRSAHQFEGEWGCLNEKVENNMSNKVTVIHHSADFDGLFCREIARKFLPGAELLGWDHKDAKIPQPKEGTIYILDLSPECLEVSEENPACEERIVWIDHHKTSIAAYSDKIPGYRIDGVAACRLAWQWFTLQYNPNDPRKPGYWHEDTEGWNANVTMPDKIPFVRRSVVEPLAVRLAGEYDVWDKRDPRAEVFQFGLRSRELSEFDWAQLLGHSTNGVNMVLTGLLENGEMLQRYQQRTDVGVMERSFVCEWEGLKFLCLNTARCNSLTFAAKDVPETGHEALLGFYYDGRQWNVSLYHARHRTELDLSAIAVKHGGGGHRGACGFRSETFPLNNETL